MSTTPPPKKRPTGEPVQAQSFLRQAATLADLIRRRPVDNVDVESPVQGIPWCREFTAIFRNVLSKKECAQLIDLSEAAGYEQALVNVGGGRQKLIADYRNSHRVMLDTAPLSAAIFDRIRPHLRAALRASGGKLPRGKVGAPLEFNERLRFLRYTGGEFFEQHMDGSYVRPRGHAKQGDRSHLTVLVYLNAGYSGSTRLFNTGGNPLNVERASHFDVVPEVGMVFVHEHRILHSGQPITEGTKYVIRTDLMFSRSDERVAEAEAAAAAATAHALAWVGGGAGATSAAAGGEGAAVAAAAAAPAAAAAAATPAASGAASGGGSGSVGDAGAAADPSNGVSANIDSDGGGDGNTDGDDALFS